MNTPKVLDNMEVCNFLAQYTNYSDMPSWIDDVFSGAVQQTRSSTSTNPISKSTLFRIVQSLRELSVETVAATYNRKRVALGDEPITERMARYIASAAYCASQGIAYHFGNHNEVGYVEIVPERTPVAGNGFTEEQKIELRRLAIKNPSEFKVRYAEFLKGLTDFQGFKMDVSSVVTTREPSQEEKDALHMATLSNKLTNKEVQDLYNKTWGIK